MKFLLERRLLIGVVLLSGVMGCSHAHSKSPAKSITVDSVSDLRLNLPPDAEVQKSLIQTEIAEHHLTLSPDSMEVSSRFDLSWDRLPGNRLLFFGHAKIPGMKLVEVSLNGKPIEADILEGELPAVALKPLENVISKTQRLVIRYRRSLPEDQGGIKRITTHDLLQPARLIYSTGKLGYDLRPTSFFSFGDTAKTHFVFNGVPKGWRIIASSPLSETEPFSTEPLVTGRFSALFIDKDRWNVSNFDVTGTKFQLLTRKTNPVLYVKEVKNAVRNAWPKYVALFGRPTSHVVIADLDWDVISGGLIGANMIGLFSLPDLPKQAAEAIAADLEWTPGNSTRQLVERNYTGTKHPWREYLQGMIAHELAHFYFGLGQTTEFAREIHEMWFSLGMGMVYDRLVTEQIVGRPDPFFKGVEKNWESKFKENSTIDQRLIRPDTSKDKSAQLSRAHVYAHGKASYVLRDLRNRIGPTIFDEKVRQYLRSETGGYPAFRTVVADQLSTVEKWEKDWEIGFELKDGKR